MVWLNTRLATVFDVTPIKFFTTEQHLDITLYNGDWIMAGFDITMLFFGGIFGLVAKHMYSKQIKHFSKKTLSIKLILTLRKALHDHSLFCFDLCWLYIT